MGIADQIKDGLMILDGLNKDEAARRFWCVDRNGLLVESMGNALRHAQMAYARPDEEVANYPRQNPDQNAIRLLDGECLGVAPLPDTCSHSRGEAYRSDRHIDTFQSIQRGNRPGDGKACRPAYNSTSIASGQNRTH